MRIVIIFVNFLLITLILYSFMNSKLIEGLSKCSGSEKNAIYRQQALTNRLFSEMNALKLQANVTDQGRKANTRLIAANTRKARGAVSDMNDAKKEKEKELDDLESENSQPGAAPIPKGSGGEKKFAKAIGNSAGTARF